MMMFSNAYGNFTILWDVMTCTWTVKYIDLVVGEGFEDYEVAEAFVKKLQERDECELQKAYSSAMVESILHVIPRLPERSARANLRSADMHRMPTRFHLGYCGR